MLQRISRFSVGQTAKVIGVLYAIMGALMLPIFLLAALLAPDQGYSIIFAFLFPVLYGVFGVIFTAIACVLYNWVAKMVGGIEVRLDAPATPGSGGG